MAYVKNNWVDQDVERPKTYEMTNNADGSVTLIDSFGLVNEIGTPVNADNMNHIEEGIAGCDLRKYNLTETYEKGEWVTGTVNDVKSIYESLVNNNYGNLLTDETKWREIKFGDSDTLNNPFFFGMSLYSEVNPNNASWLLSNGQDNTQGMYPDYYDWILENVNNGTENFKGSIGYCYENINGSGWWWISTDNPKVGMTVYEYNSDSIIPVGTVQLVSNNQITFNHKFSNIVYTLSLIHI